MKKMSINKKINNNKIYDNHIKKIKIKQNNLINKKSKKKIKINKYINENK